MTYSLQLGPTTLSFYHLSIVTSAENSVFNKGSFEETGLFFYLFIFPHTVAQIILEHTM